MLVSQGIGLGAGRGGREVGGLALPVYIFVWYLDVMYFEKQIMKAFYFFLSEASSLELKSISFGTLYTWIPGWIRPLSV